MAYEVNTEMALDAKSFSYYQNGMQKLKILRDAKGLTQAQLAEMAGTSQPQIMRLEASKRRLTKEWAERLAPHLGVEPVDLIFDFGDINMGRVAELRASGLLPSAQNYRPPPEFFDRQDKLKIFASAEGGNGTLVLSTEPYEYLPRPHTLEGIPEAYGILIEGESMFPAYEPGDVAWVNPRLGPRKDTDVILYGIEDKTGEARATIKRIAGMTDSHWTLQQWNPNKKFKLDRGIWRECHRVVGKFSKR